jgi:CRISPR-associated endonuclease/helicase Cas3
MWAHSANTVGDRHLLVDHLYGTAALARRFAEPFGAGDAAYFAGLAHDAGKASCAWQDGLLRAEADGDRVGVDHKTLGVELAGERGVGLLQFALHGHHGGLTNADTVVGSLQDTADRAGRQRRAEAERALRGLLPELFDQSPVALPAGFSKPLEQEFLIRFLFSCLVDADGLDTEAHRFALAAPRVARAAQMDELWERFETRRTSLFAGRASSPVDRWRDEVYAASVAAAVGPAGIYRLPAPTGSGKTLAAAGFALRHAAARGKSRVIVAVPFVTITEQNAAVYRSMLDPGHDDADPVVLEHHSSVALDGTSRRHRWQRLAAENWDAPFVVTTTVQLFESLFGRKPARMRKVHRLANAVIVLDEVQALPHALLPPIVDGLRLLTERFGATVLLASATQPQWWALREVRETTLRDIIADPAPLYRALRRARYEWWLEPKPTLEQVARRAAGHPQALVVVNTVANARAVYDALRSAASSGVAVRHLSATMCARHRRDVLDEVRTLLRDGQPALLVSTQLIEAGVDVDFPVVYRALAPADSLQQAAGRANREGQLGLEGGLVVVFDPADGNRPDSYKTPVDITMERFGPSGPRGQVDPDDLETLAGYYRALYIALGIQDRDKRGQVIQRNRGKADFLAVADGPQRDAGRTSERNRSLAFRMIDDDTVPIVVKYGNPAERDQVRGWLGQLRSGDAPPGMLFRALQPYMTAIRRATASRGDVAAWCRPVIGDLLEWTGEYDEAGLVLELSGEHFLV